MKSYIIILAKTYIFILTLSIIKSKKKNCSSRLRPSSHSFCKLPTKIRNHLQYSFFCYNNKRNNTCFPSLFIIDRSTTILSVLGKLGAPHCCCSARYSNSRSRWSDCSRSRQTTIKTSISISPICIFYYYFYSNATIFISPSLSIITLLPKS